MNRRNALAALGALTLGAASAKDSPPTGTWVAVMRRGEIFTIDAVIVVPVALRDAWEVLTDFDGMTSFVPNLTLSRVVSRAGDNLRVEQRGRLKWGLVDEPYEATRDVQLTPTETIRSSSVEGARPPEQGLTRLKEVPSGTEMWHHSDLAMVSWMPDAVSQRFLERVMNARYEAIAAEMVRRRGSRAVGRSGRPAARE